MEKEPISRPKIEELRERHWQRIVRPSLSEKARGVLDFLLEKYKGSLSQTVTVNLKELGNQFGVSSTRISQVIEGLKDSYPEFKILLPKEERKLFLSQVEQARKMDPHLPNEEIAQNLGVPVWQVQYAVHKLIQTGRTENRLWLRQQQKQERKERVRQLRNEGRSNQEIEEILEISKQTLERLVRELIAEGAIEPQRIRRPQEKIMEFDREIEKLSQEGLSRRKIAEMLWEENPEVDQKIWLYLVFNSFTRKRERERKLARAA